MNILVLAKDYPPTVGGVENYSKNLAEGLAQFHSVKVVSFASKSIIKGDIDSVWVHRITPFVELELFKAVQLMFYLFWSLLSNRLDVVYATTWKVALPMLVLRPFFRVKLFISIHGAEVTRHKSSALTLQLMRRVLMTASEIISVSHFTKSKALEYCPKLEPNKVTVVPNGIDFNKLSLKDKIEARSKLGIDQKDFVLLTTSRVDSRKGHMQVIKAIPELSKRIQNLKYVVVGDGPLRESLEREVKKLNIEKFVRFTGFVDFADLDYLYSCCDLFILLNRFESDVDFEGFGLVFAEAMFYQIPVIAGDNSGPKEVVINGETGFLIEPNSAALLQLFSKKEFTKSVLRGLGEKAQTHTLENFSLKKMIHNTHIVLNKN